jgi:hypothetical protein
VKSDFNFESEIKLKLFYEFEIYSQKHKEKIEELTERATQERKIENDLDKVESIWKEIEFEL